MGKIRTITLVCFVIILSCQNTNWLESPPEEFQGKFTQVSDEIIQGYEKPIIIEIDDKELRYTSKEDTVVENYSILKVSRSGDHVVIFCGNENEIHISEFRYEMFWGADNYLHVSEIVATGNEDQNGEFVVGKFTSNEFTKPIN